jgi:carboxypeptidase Taq
MKAYRELEARFQRIALVGEAAGVLHWDMSTMMPPGGAAARAEQLAALTVVRHELLTDPAMGELIETAGAAAVDLDGWQRANLREMRRRWVHATAVPAALVEARSKAVSACETVWRTARAESDYAAVKPLLRQVLDLTRETAAAKADALGVSPYDALIDAYEPDGRGGRIDAIFDELTAFLPDFLQAVLDRQAQASAPLPLDGPFPVAAQQALARRLSALVGFDFARGRLDESPHPFSGGVPEDARITTRYDEADPMPGLMAVLHETGHAIGAISRSAPPAAWCCTRASRSWSRCRPAGPGRSSPFWRRCCARPSPARVRPGRLITCTGWPRASSRVSSGSTPTRSPTRPIYCCATGWRRR